MKEHTDVCRSIIVQLNYLGHFAWKNQTGVVKKDGCWISYGYPGSPDIFCIMKGGKFLGIEVKAGKDKQREKQVLFENIVKHLGAQYLVVRSLDDFQRQFIGASEAKPKKHNPS